MKVIGFCGTFAAGKDAAIEFILHKFKKRAIAVSTSDLVREETTRRGLPLTRENLQLVSNETRLALGSGVFAKRAAERINANRQGKEVALVSGTRTVGEIEELRRFFGKNFHLIAVDAPVETRYERVKQRRREGEEVLGFKEFKQSEERELKSAGKHSHNILQVMQMADFTIQNNGTKKQLEEKVEEILKKLVKS